MNILQSLDLQSILIGYLLLALLLLLIVFWRDIIEKISFHRYRKVSSTLSNLTPIELAKRLDLVKVKTLNVYKRQDTTNEIYESAVNMLIDYIVTRGYSLFQDTKDFGQATFKGNPVIVILPSQKIWLLHSDQKEERDQTIPFIVDPIFTLEDFNMFKNQITMMEGVTNE